MVKLQKSISANQKVSESRDIKASKRKNNNYVQKISQMSVLVTEQFITAYLLSPGTLLYHFLYGKLTKVALVISEFVIFYFDVDNWCWNSAYKSGFYGYMIGDNG